MWKIQKHFENQEIKKSHAFNFKCLFQPIFSYKPVNINPDSFFWQKIVIICHIACPNWIKNVDFRGFFHLRVENPGFRVNILKLRFLKKGSMKYFKNCTKQSPSLYIFTGGMSCLCSWKKLILPQKPTVPYQSRKLKGEHHYWWQCGRKCSCIKIEHVYISR